MGYKKDITETRCYKIIEVWEHNAGNCKSFKERSETNQKGQTTTEREMENIGNNKKMVLRWLQKGYLRKIRVMSKRKSQSIRKKIFVEIDVVNVLNFKEQCLKNIKVTKQPHSHKKVTITKRNMYFG